MCSIVIPEILDLFDTLLNSGAPFRKFASMRDEWAMKNRYISPGMHRLWIKIISSLFQIENVHYETILQAPFNLLALDPTTSTIPCCWNSEHRLERSTLFPVCLEEIDRVVVHDMRESDGWVLYAFLLRTTNKIHCTVLGNIGWSEMQSAFVLNHF